MPYLVIPFVNDRFGAWLLGETPTSIEVLKSWERFLVLGHGAEKNVLI
jgi:hypothetical protein